MDRQQDGNRNGCWIAVQYVAAIVVTLCLGFLWLDETMLLASMLFAMLFWLLVPAFVIVVVSFVMSLRCNSKHKRILLGIHLVNVLLFCLFFFNPGRKCNADIMERHYLKYGDRMSELYEEVDGRLKPGVHIDVEFEHGKVSIFHVSDDCCEPDYCWDPSEEKVDSLLERAGLDRTGLNLIERRLKDIGCISLAMGGSKDEPYVIGFRRIGMGKYSFRIFHKALSAEEQEEINDVEVCQLVYSPTVVFEFAGGAIGLQKFPGKEEYLEKKKVN